MKPADEYLLIMFVMPVGPYFKAGFKPVDMMICRDFDRAAPQGNGHREGRRKLRREPPVPENRQGKGLFFHHLSGCEGKEVHRRMRPANFFGIKGQYIRDPESGKSILPSITNKSLQQLAEHLGYKGGTPSGSFRGTRGILRDRRMRHRGSDHPDQENRGP